MPELFLDNFWAGSVIWAALYVSDCTWTLTCARLYHAGARNKMAFEGSYEITPYYQRDIDALRRLSPRFLLILVVGVMTLVILGQALAPASPETYSFLLGALVLVQLTVHIRHVRNYFLFRAMATDAVRGRIEYSRPLMLKASSIEVFAFAVLFMVVFVFTQSAFVLGGAVACATLAVQHWRLIPKSASDPSSTTRSLC